MNICQFRCFIVVVAGAAAVLQAASAAAQQGDVQHVHDPSIIKQGGQYYIFSTGRGIPVRQSADLRSWKRIGSVFEAMPDWAKQEIPAARDVWAPCISFFQNEYRLYYAVSTFGKNRSCIGLAVNKTLDPQDKDYRWIDRGQVIASQPSDNWNAIDPNFALDAQGQPWLCFGSFWSGIKLRHLDARSGGLAAGEPQQYSLATRVRPTAVEAAFIVRKNGRFYLFVSFDQCCRGVNSTYKIMVGRAPQITGPYEDRDGRPMLQGGGTLVLAGSERYRGPGHNSVLRDGDKDWLVFHFYDAAANGVSTLQIRPLLWSDDGWPRVGAPLSGEENVDRRSKAVSVMAPGS